MDILSNKIKVGKKFVAVSRCQYERQKRYPIDFFAVFFTEAKGDRIVSYELWEEYVFGIGKNTNADRHRSADRRLGTSELDYRSCCALKRVSIKSQRYVMKTIANQNRAVDFQIFFVFYRFLPN